MAAGCAGSLQGGPRAAEDGAVPTEAGTPTPDLGGDVVQPGAADLAASVDLLGSADLASPPDLLAPDSPPDPCAKVSCTSPPAPTCLSGMTLRSYAKTGTCKAGSCSYAKTDKACLAGCSAGACTPTYGWDYNLKHRCVTSPTPGTVNFYSDKTDCPVAGKHWAVAVQSEKTLGATCIGANSHSLPINAGGPLTLYWQKHTDALGRANWTVDLKTDLMAHAHPCGAGTYTWYAFMDHVYHGGGPFPTPDKVVFSATVTYDDWTPNGAARAIAGWGGEWDGKGVLVEIDLQSKNWGDAYPKVADVVQVVNNATMQWVELYGPAMGISIPRKAATPITINWHSVIANLISRGYLVGPKAGLSKAKTSSVSLATEVTHYGSTGVVAELWATDWRVRAK